MFKDIGGHAPRDCSVEEWQAPGSLPLEVYYREDYLPDSFLPADLILTIGENPGVAELVVEVPSRWGPVGRCSD